MSDRQVTANVNGAGTVNIDVNFSVASRFTLEFLDREKFLIRRSESFGNVIVHQHDRFRGVSNTVGCALI